ncbi:MAG: transcription-repair coupling factor, partial [Prevotellaceae bacterium]|nr:transcription-repair coupling factor [Prevotellaceae bacterium]
MTINELQQRYAAHPQVEAVDGLLKDASVRSIYCKGLCASAAPLVCAALAREAAFPFLFILGDLEEAGYFYHDLVQLRGEEHVLFFPSSFRRAVKYGQRDAAGGILRTEALARLQKNEPGLCIVTYPDALAEKVVSPDALNQNTLEVQAGERLSPTFLDEVLRGYGFERVEYVYEPGQYALRGSIVDLFSFSSEYPYRIDFFGDEVDSIRLFEVETQLSRQSKQRVVIVPDLTVFPTEGGDGRVSLLGFLPKETVLAARDFPWVHERIAAVHDEAMSPQAIAARESEEEVITLDGMLSTGEEFLEQALSFRWLELGAKPAGTPQATVTFDTSLQPVYHKNFDMVSASFKQYLQQGYTLYICSDSLKQIERIRSIFEDRGDNIVFTPVERTLHEGFADNTLRLCLFTDHQLFDRFHKYSLRSEKVRGGKVALSLKELNQFTPGDYVVH